MRPIVYLIGSGPGDPGLISARGARYLAAADVVLYDRLVSPRLLRHAAPAAERIDVGGAAPDELAQETGGRVFFPKQIGELANVYGQISEELSSQYTVGYTSRNPKRDGAWRRLVVRTDVPSATARTKQGYYGPTS